MLGSSRSRIIPLRQLYAQRGSASGLTKNDFVGCIARSLSSRPLDVHRAKGYQVSSTDNRLPHFSMAPWIASLPLGVDA